MHEALNAASEEIDRLTAENENLRGRGREGSSQTSNSENTALVDALQQILRGNKDNKRSVKLPDPEVFTGEVNREPHFRTWKALMENKLEVNADHFPTRLSKAAYVFSRTSGQVATILRPYVETRSPLVRTSDLMIELIKENFDDPFYVSNRKQQLRALYQRNKPFPEFHSQFLILATNLNLY